MRFLLTCVPGLGHFNPLAPLARALQQAGHAVAVASAPGFRDVVERAGLEFLPVGLDWDERHLLETLPELRSVAKVYRGEWMMRNVFLDRSPRKLVPDLLTAAPAWGADMIVAGSFEYGGSLAAELLGLPCAVASYTVPWDPWVRKLALGRGTARLRAHFGLPPDPQLTAFDRNPDFCFAPPCWRFDLALLRPGLTRLVAAKVRSTDLPLRQRWWGLRALLQQRVFAASLRRRRGQEQAPRNLHFVNATAPGSDQEGEAAALLANMPRQPTVLVSLGTVLGSEYWELFERILSALRDQPVNVILTLGGTGDPARFGPQPANVRIVDVLTQAQIAALLDRVDLCINHGGYGSVTEALAHGVPVLALPVVSDAPMNTQMCLSTGVMPELPPQVWGLSPKGLPVILPERLTADVIRDAALQALNDPAFRAAARRQQEELSRRASLADAIRLLEQAAARSRSPDRF